MVVLGRNKLWELDMPFVLFCDIKEKHPDTLMVVEELTESMYKEKKEIPIRELEDWSVARNMEALGRK
jgi:hypothetical protein